MVNLITVLPNVRHADKRKIRATCVADVATSLEIATTDSETKAGQRETGEG